MKFLQPLLSSKPTPLMLLDMAYIVVLLPLMLMLKVPMMLFVLMVLGILLVKKSPASNPFIFTVFLLGLVALYLSLYGAFSFTGLSRLKLFLELLVYILIIVVSLQRLTREINYYLLISPFLFLALSLFFYHGIVMLSYVIFEIFFLLWMILSHRMESNLVESFRSSMVMFMYSLPWVVVLFIFFPRISFEHASYGFKGEVTKRMGHDGTMYLDGNALLVPSDRIVMEVGFEGEVPDVSTLYFRGSVLYVDKKDHWEPLPKYIKREIKQSSSSQGEAQSYKVTLYPTQKKWLYLLDMPKHAVKESQLDSDLVSTVEKKIEEPLHYSASSVLSPYYVQELDAVTLAFASHFSEAQNPKSYKEAKKIKEQYERTAQRTKALVGLFIEQNLTYTLKPEALDINASTDSFLFDKRGGYCVHFASSFVTVARMLDIPARVVTGYKSDRSESLKNYLAVKEKDAHAWAELYIDGRWVRYETTSTATNIDQQAQDLARIAQNKKELHPLLKKLNLYLMYTKYQIETWILYYSHVRQLQLLEYAKKNPSFVFGFVLGFIGLVMVSFVIIAYFRRPSYSSEALAIMQPLLKSLKKEGYLRNEDESMHQFLLRVSKENPTNRALKEVDSMYEEILYGEDVSTKKQLELKKYVKKATMK